MRRNEQRREIDVAIFQYVSFAIFQNADNDFKHRKTTNTNTDLRFRHQPSSSLQSFLCYSARQRHQ